mmetsp:Transcript_73448/g.192613  ORF Transcript_73448/g.192613 Transcript_73448/m.192613 type:complete len:304 (-) Transcript_73448:266-1177(-)
MFQGSAPWPWRLLTLLVVGARAQIFPSVFGGLAPTPPPVPPPAQPAAPQATIELPDDMGCLASPRAAVWGQTKKKFRALFNQSPFQPIDRATLSASLEVVLKDLKAAGALQADDCGIGKLCLQLLSFANVDDPLALVQLFEGFEQLSSPVLTLLLDVPWVVLAQSGWPVFAMLAQINMRKGMVPEVINSDAIDGVADPAGQEFQAYLMAGLQAGNIQVVEQVSAAYLQMGSQVGGSALAPLTALAAQATGGKGVQRHLEVLDALQAGFKQVIGTGAELDVSLSTRWPLWGLMHVGVDALYPEE